MGDLFRLGFWALAAVLACVGAFAVYRGVFGDRARGRSRCPKCWYDMSGAVGLRCPECGKSARDEKALVRTRRRWRLVLMGFVLIVVASVPVGGLEAVGRGWVKPAPDTLLILAAGSVDDPEHPVLTELGRRLGVVGSQMRGSMYWYRDQSVEQANLWRWQRFLIASRFAHFVVTDTSSDSLKQFALAGLTTLAPESKCAIPALRRVVSNGTSSHCHLAIQALEELGPAAAPAVGDLTTVLDDLSIDTYYAQSAIRALAAIGPSSAGAVTSMLSFCDRLTSEWSDVSRREIYEAFGRIGPGAIEALPRLIDVARSSSSLDRAVAVESVGRIAPEDERAARLLLDALQSDELNTRDAAAIAIRARSELLLVALGELEELLSSEEASARITALWGFIVLGPKSVDSIKAIRAALHDEHPIVRALAVEAHGTMGAKAQDSIDFLKVVAEDKDPFVAAEARRVIRRLGDLN